MLVLMFVEEELAGQGLDDWLADGDDIFSKLAQKIWLKLEDFVVYRQ